MMYDYFLYDNRTLGPGGYDWNIKAATGPLQDDTVTREKFAEYRRHSLGTRAGTLCNFGAALGGIRLKGGEYLLCVTLEIQDRHERPSSAFIGIYCPNADALRSLLTKGDPLLIARRVYAGTPPPQLTLEGSPLSAAGGQTTAGSTREGLHPFQADSSPGNVAAILLNHLAKGGALPSILGITVWNANTRHLLGNYQFAFCLQLPPGAAVRQAKESSNDSLQGSTLDSLQGSTLKEASGTFWPWAGVLSLAVVILIYWFFPPRIDRETSAVQETRPKPDPVVVVQPPPDDPNHFLTRFLAILDHIDAISSEKLLKTPEYKTLTEVKVLAPYEGNRSTMIRLLEVDLRNFRNAVRETNFRHFFQASRMNDFNPAQRVTEIRRLLGGMKPPREGCNLLRSSFRYWTEQQNSGTGEWCGLVEDFAKEISESSK